MQETGTDAAIAILHQDGWTAHKMGSGLGGRIKQRDGDEPVSLGEDKAEWVLCVEDPTDLGPEVLLGGRQRVVPRRIHGERQEDDVEDILRLRARSMADKVTACRDRSDSGGFPGEA